MIFFIKTVRSVYFLVPFCNDTFKNHKSGVWLSPIMRILGIDDNQDLLDLCNVALSNEGHEYTGIDNGKEGLQAIKDEKFDLVLLDLSMPDFTGQDVLDALVKEGIMDKHKIIVFTASALTKKETDLYSEKGVHSTISKPVEIDFLIETIKKMPSDV